MSDREAKVLIVDDVETNLLLLQRIMQKLPVEVHKASSGREALALLRENHYIVVLLDIMMPVIDGFKLAELMHKDDETKDIPIIFITASDKEAGIEIEGYNHGAVDVLYKPVNAHVLRCKVQVFLNLYQSRLKLIEMNKSMQRFVPNEFLKLLNRPSLMEIELGDNIEEEITVMFADIRSFTDFSENITSEDIFKFMNAYLSRMGPIIRKHNGFIDKYIGDSIMALFGDADEAVSAAVEMLVEIKKYNTVRSKRNRNPIKIGIGLNTGSLRLGTIGEKERIEGTAIGDAVNLASRIEGLTKPYKTSLLISNKTYDRLKRVPTEYIRAIDRVAVKGKKEIVTIYELLETEPKETQKLKKETLVLFEDGMTAYYKKDFKTAQGKFQEVLDLNSGDNIANIFFERCGKLLQKGVADTWDGIERRLTK